MDQLAEGFKALADPTRLRLLALLLHGELCVCDLMAALDLPQSTVSRHLGSLKKEGWVAGRRCGQWMHYRLARPGHPLLATVMELLEARLGDDETAKQDAARLQQRLRMRPDHCCA
jgi:ArsR family transcriptional regulator, arsenate/arsenite/antimonite-responsive transcriptional repressor